MNAHSNKLNTVENTIIAMRKDMISLETRTRPLTSSSISTNTRTSTVPSYHQSREHRDEVISSTESSFSNDQDIESQQQEGHDDMVVHDIAPRHREDFNYVSAQETESQHHEEGDYIDVQALDNVLHLNTDLNCEAVTGYINSISELITAKIVNRFPRNVISRRRAAELNLQIQYDDDQEQDTIIEFEGIDGIGRQRALGRVTFGWKADQLQKSRALNVTCLVCGYVPYPLIFGQSFLRRRRHYWQE